MKVLIYKKIRILEVWKSRGYGANATTYGKVDFAKEVKPKKSKLLSINRNETIEKIVSEDLASVSWQCRAWRQQQDGH